MKKIVLRNEAKKLNLKRYFTNVACNNGHIDERYTCSGACIPCLKKAIAKCMANSTADRYKWRKENPQVYKDYQREYQRKYKLTARGKQTNKQANDRWNAKKRNKPTTTGDQQ